MLREMFLSYWGADQEADITELEKQYKAGNYNGSIEKGLWKDGADLEEAFRKMKSMRTNLMAKMTPQQRFDNSQIMTDTGLAKIIMSKNNHEQG